MTAAALVAFITLAVFRLPTSFIEQLENSQLLTLSERGWAFRLLALFAVAQAVYVGLGVFRIDRAKEARENDPRINRLTPPEFVSSLARTAATIILLTMVYGLAALGFTGFRAGFWFFVALAHLQGLWYFREVGQIAKWLDFQPDTSIQSTGGTWEPGADYCPPLARGLQPWG